MVTKVRGASSQDFQSIADMEAYDAPVGAGGNSVSCTGKFIFNTVVADN